MLYFLMFFVSYRDNTVVDFWYIYEDQSENHLVRYCIVLFVGNDFAVLHSILVFFEAAFILWDYSHSSVGFFKSVYDYFFHFYRYNAL